MQKEHNRSIKNLKNYHIFELEEKEKVFFSLQDFILNIIFCKVFQRRA